MSRYTFFLGLPKIDMLLLITILTFSDNKQKRERREDKNSYKFLFFFSFFSSLRDCKSDSMSYRRRVIIKGQL